MKNFKRMFKFVKGYYRYFVLSLIMIIIVQLLGFASPLIVKSILDDCILGIEYSWVQVEDESSQCVYYHENYYKQTRYLDEDDVVVSDASIVLYKTGFYFTNDRVKNGSKSISGDILTVKDEFSTYTYEVTKLSATEVTKFYQPIFRILIILLIILFLKSVLVIVGSYIQRLSTSKVLTVIARKGRTVAMEQVEKLPVAYFESEPAGKMAARITSDVDGIITLYRQVVNVVIGTVLSFILAYVGMFYLNVKLALLSFIIYPFIYIWVRFFLKRLKKFAEKVNELRSLLTAKINEIINGINILQIFNFKKQTVSEFNKLNTDFKNEQMKEVNLHITLGWNMINVVRGIVTAAIVAYFGWQYMTFSEIVVTAGLIYAYNEYLLKIVDPIGILFNQISEYQHAMVRTERIHKIIEGPTEDISKHDIPRYHGDIKFDNVWFSYVNNDYVLKGVSFDIKAGQMIGLVGHTGSGKSSLMNLLLRFYDLKEKGGNIYIDGMDITTYSKRSYRSNLGIVLQEPTLFKGTIASNIRFGTNVTDEEIMAVLKSIGGDKLIKKFPLGINQPITRAGVNMSSGEKQIISLARAIIHNPSILIMDEATSHIDTETEEIIKRALTVVCKNRTVIVIAHRLSTIYNADKIIVLDHGLKVEEGTHQSLVAANGVYANIYRAQVANTEALSGISNQALSSL